MSDVVVRSYTSVSECLNDFWDSLSTREAVTRPREETKNEMNAIRLDTKGISLRIALFFDAYVMKLKSKCEFLRNAPSDASLRTKRTEKRKTSIVGPCCA